MSAAHNRFDTIEQIVDDGVARGLGWLRTSDAALDGRTVTVAGRELLNFGSCSYLGLERDPALALAVKATVDRYGTQFSSSRMYLELGLYAVLEGLLEEIFERPCLACASTTLGHISALPVLVEDGDAVLLDQQVHHSVQTAAQLLKARGVPLTIVRHNRVDRLARAVDKLSSRHRRVWYLADGVYSMFGDAAPAAELRQLLADEERLWLYVDDAHGVSWAGRAGQGHFLSHFGQHDRLVLAASLNKSFAAAGGVLTVPSPRLKHRIRACGPTMIFSGPIQPPMLGAAIASARVHLSERLLGLQSELSELVAHANAESNRLGLPQVAPTGTPLFFIPVGLPRTVYAMVHALLQDGCYVNAATFPAVPMTQGGVRFTVHRGVSRADVTRLLESLASHYHPILEREGSGLVEVEKAFRLTGFQAPGRATREAEIAPDSGLRAVAPSHSPPPLGAASRRVGRLEVHRRHRIAEVSPELWDGIFAGRGPLTRRAHASAERSLSTCADARARIEPGYLWVQDDQGQPILATAFFAGLTKEDMFAKSEVSAKLEAIRESEDPDYLVAKVVSLGTPLSLGEHLFLDRSHGRWREALALLVDELQAFKAQTGASQIVLREFCPEQEELRTEMLRLGFFEYRLPDMLRIDAIHWKSRQEYLSGLGQRYRYNLRRETLAHEDDFVAEFNGAFSEEEKAYCYSLYRQVHARGRRINVFPLPRAYFDEMLDNPEYDVMRLRLRERGERSLPVGVLYGHHHCGAYSALVVGLDYSCSAERGVYKQILFRCVERAQSLGARSLNLAYTADLEKKKLGARPYATCAYVQSDDNFAASVMESL